jgi:hypothetical protein
MIVIFDLNVKVYIAFLRLFSMSTMFISKTSKYLHFMQSQFDKVHRSNKMILLEKLHF